MGNCGNADPDIVGPGVLAAFVLSALITFSAIVIGYFTESLPDEHLNSLDFAVIDWFCDSALGKALSYIRSNFVPLIRKCFFPKSPAQPRKALTKARREVAFEKFVLALSDQQLVTGIAILVAVFANHCRTSIYELNIAISLAWFSCTTHLATLDVLHRYFRLNTVVRNWRMIGMIGVLVLLIPGLVLIEIYQVTAPQVPIPCFDRLPNNSDNTIGPLASIFVIAYLVAAYTGRLYKVFTSEDGSMVDPEWLVWNTLLRLFSKLPRSERRAVVEKAIRVCNTRRTIRIEEKVEALSATSRFMKRFGLCFGAYSRSFLQLIASLFFLLSFGISAVVADRWLDFDVDLEDRSSTMEFGQIVPLVLLIIPLLAYAEVFYEKPDKTPADEQDHAGKGHNQKSSTRQRSQASHILSTAASAASPPFQPSSSLAEVQIDTTEDHDPPTAPKYAGFAFVDIKSRLPRPFLDRSRHLISLMCISQILLGISTGILLNLSGEVASGGGVMLCIPWAFSFASASRRFLIVGKVVRGLMRKDREAKFEDMMASDSWERMTDRKGRVCYVHHGMREAMWLAPSANPYETKA